MSRTVRLGGLKEDATGSNSRVNLSGRCCARVDRARLDQRDGRAPLITAEGYTASSGLTYSEVDLAGVVPPIVLVQHLGSITNAAARYATKPVHDVGYGGAG